MKLSTSLSALAGLSTAVSNPLDSSFSSSSSSSAPLPLDPAHLFQNPDPLSSSSSSSSSPEAQRIPTSYESAVLGRRVLALTPLATLSTVFPPSSSSSEEKDQDAGVGIDERRPAGLGGVPVGLMDYIADCEDAGDPTILAIRIATSFKNADAGSNVSVSVSWAPPYPPRKRIESEGQEGGEDEDEEAEPGSMASLYRGLRSWWRARRRASASASDDDEAYSPHRRRHYDPAPYSAANLPRFSLLGYLEPIPTPDDDDDDDGAAEALRACFLRSHPDARYWLPGNRIHESAWVRLVVTQVYWIGGFGDRAYIGWIPAEEWHNVTRDEWEAVRLPGEKKGWEEWSVEGSGSERSEGEWEL